MAELWSEFWWLVILGVLLIAGGGVRWTRQRD